MVKTVVHNTLSTDVPCQTAGSVQRAAVSTSLLSLDDEWRATGVYGLEVTRDGRVRNARGRELKQILHGNGNSKGWRVMAYENHKLHEQIVRTLVARAWLPDYYDGCCVKFLDGNPLNVHADNCEVCTRSEYMQWLTLMSFRKKYADLIKEYGEFRPSGVEDIEITKDGIGLRNGIIYKPRKVIAENGRKETSVIGIMIDGKRRYFYAADLVARAWLKKFYYEGCRITFRDYDNHNLNADNLRIVSADEFNRYTARNSHKTIAEKITIDDEIAKLDEINECCAMSKRLLESGDYTEVNEYVTKNLLPRLMRYAMKEAYMSRSQARSAVPIAISHLYELLDTNRGTYQFYWYCCKALRKIKRYGEYVRPNLPVKIERRVQPLELQALCDKFRFTKL